MFSYIVNIRSKADLIEVIIDDQPKHYPFIIYLQFYFIIFNFIS